MENSELDNLEALARVATPGPWMDLGYTEEPGAGHPPQTEVYTTPIMHYIAGPLGEEIEHSLTPQQFVCTTADPNEGFQEEQAEANAAYIAATNPSTILSLVAEIRRLQAVGNWISVADRLPETKLYEANTWMKWHSSNTVLAIEAGEKKAGLYWCDEKGQWRQYGLEFHGHYAQVTHWQPLPAAPTMEGGPTDAS